MGSSSKKVTTGYWYYLDSLMTFCHGPIDEITEIQVGGRTAWTGSVTSSQTINIDKTDLFGGQAREGGVQGNVDVMFGQPNQSVNEYLGASIRASGITGPLPAYRRLFSLFFRGSTTNAEFTNSAEFSMVGSPPPAFRWSANNPYFKGVRVKARRYWGDWYSAKKRIGNHANPAHVIYECLTNPDWGMGYPTGDIDSTRWQQAADTLYTEGFGISLEWKNQTSIEDFIKLILNHINAVVNQDRTTGKLFLRLVRNDYDTGTLKNLNPTNSVLVKYGRPGFGETVNEIVLKYTTANGETDSVTVQDLAGITSQGQVVSQTIELPGIRDVNLAARVAQRELEQRTKPLSSLTLEVNRIAYDLYEGDVFAFSWSDIGITEAYYRVLSVNLGQIDSNMIQIEAMEDVFGMPSASYIKPQPVGWVDTNQAPTNVVHQRVVEASYWEVVKSTAEADRNTFPAEFGFAAILAVRPQTDTARFELYSSPNNSTYSDVGPGDWTPSATLVSDIDFDDTVLTVTNNSLWHLVTVGSLGYIDNEMFEVTAFTGTTVTVKRGVIDTVPVRHTAGARLWFHGDALYGDDPDIKANGETVYYKPLTVTSIGTLAIGFATASSIVMNRRYDRPYPPGNVKINGTAYPATITGNTVTVTWSHRDRTQQTAYVVAQNETNIGPEVGVTYNVRFYDGTTSLLLHSANTASTTYTYTMAPTSVLLHFDGTNGATTSTDSSLHAHTLTFSGNAQLSTAQTKFGTASLLLDGSGDYVSFSPLNNSFDMSTYDFTIEAFVYHTAASSGGVICRRTTGTNGWSLDVRDTGSVWLRARIGASWSDTWITTAVGSVPLNTWTHIVLERYGNNWTIYINGVASGSITNSGALHDQAEVVRIGCSSNSIENAFAGYIDELRVTRLVAKYKGAFTPPAAPFTVGDTVIPSARIELESVRDGLLSWQKHDIDVDVV